MESLRRLCLLGAMVTSWVWGGCATVGESVADLNAETRAPIIELLVSNGTQAGVDQYPTTLMVESAAAPKFSGKPGSVGQCSGVLIAQDLLLTAAHCMCSQPIHYSVNKSLNRSDCASRARVKQYVQTRQFLSSEDEDVERVVLDFPRVWGTVFFPDEFRVDIDADGNLSPIRADIAVIRLDKPINVRLDHEPSDRKFEEGDRITVVGFGSTSVNGQQSSMQPFLGQNTVTGTRVMEYQSRPPPGKQHREGHFYRDYEANGEAGDSGGPCFREEGGRRWLMGIVLHKRQATGVKTSCLDLFSSRSLLEKLIQQARAKTD